MSQINFYEMKTAGYLRKLTISMSFVFILLIVSGTLWGQTPVAANGQLSVSGTNLVNEDGDPVQLRGMSSAGINWFTEDYNFHSLNTMVNVWGIDVFRIAVHPSEDPDQTQGGYEGNIAFWRQYVDELVDLCEQYGIYAIIDWHVLHPGDPTDPEFYQMAQDFWDYMSSKHSGKEHVLYEIANEPNGVDWSVCKSYAETIIPIIRANDPNTIILIGNPTWSSDVNVASEDPVTGYDNLMYSFHFYAGSHTDNYREKVRTALANGVAVFATEWGTTNADGNGEPNESETNIWMEFFRDNNISWCNWSYSDKDEGSAALQAYAVADEAWDNTSASGTLVKSLLQTPADSWSTAGNTPPVCQIDRTLYGSYIISGETITLTADAIDSDGSVSSISYYANGSLIGSATTAPYSVDWSPSSTGDVTLTAQVTDNGGASNSSVAYTVHVVNEIIQTAYPNGTPHPIPGTINAADFDEGGEMIAYHDIDAVHKGLAGASRWEEGIDVEGTSIIGYVVNGEWSEFTCDISGTGNYDFSLSVTSAYDVTGIIHLEVDGEPVGNSVEVPPTGSWGGFTTVTIPNVPLPGGVHVVRLVIDKGYFNYQNLVFEAKSDPPTVALTSPSSALSIDQGDVVTMTATASDSDGSIARVEFHVGGSKVAEDATAPYEGTWTAALEGNYEITAVAVDNMGTTTTSGGVSVAVNSTLQDPTTPNLALNQTATASSVEDSGFPASNAVDGSAGTRWASAFSQPEWIYVDLGSEITFERVILSWEAAYATSYEIQVSNNASSWTTAAVISAANGSVDDIVFPAVSARYVRMYGIQRVTEYGFSLYEFEVYAPEGSTEPVTGVSVAPTSVSLLIGETATLVETVEPEEATNKTVSWSSDNPSVAIVGSNGDVTAVGEGTAIITVKTADGGFTANSTVTVDPVSVESVSLDITSLGLIIGETQTLVATVLPDDATNKTISWSTSDASVATVNSSGLVSAVAEGSATITVTTADGDFTATCDVVVDPVPDIDVIGVDLDITATTIYLDNCTQLTETVQPTNATNQNVSWTSSDDGIATVDENGLVCATGLGNAVIYVTTADGGFLANCEITVENQPVEQYTLTVTVVGGGTEAIVIDPDQDLYDDGTEVTLTALQPDNGTDFVSWSGDASGTDLEITVVMDDNKEVIATYEPIEGCTNISMPYSQNGVGDNCYIASGTVKYINSWNMDYVEVNGQDFTNIWVSGEDIPASADGLIHITYFSTVGWAHFEIDGIDGDIEEVAVTGVSVLSTSATVEAGESVTLYETVTPSDATDKTVSWSTSDAEIATVSSSGAVTGIAEGTATITVTTNDGGFTASATITVTETPIDIPVTGVSVDPISASVEVGEIISIMAIVEPTNATNKEVLWNSDNYLVAEVDSFGNVTGMAEGIVTITVGTVDGGYIATTEITVTETPIDIPVTGVSIDPTSASVGVEASVTLTETVSPSDATDQNVSWSSSDEAIATVTSDGVVTGVADGIATITLTTNDGSFTASTEITVTDDIWEPCADPVTISVPYSQDGPGEFCLFTTDDIAYINSWALDVLEINGVSEYLNSYSTILPPRVNYGYYIYYVSSVGWAHFEAATFKSVIDGDSFVDVQVYPNPFDGSTSVNIKDFEFVNAVLVYDQLGKLVENFSENEINPIMNIGDGLESGIYYLKVISTNNQKTMIINKK